jgi:coenzyme F420-reducing hydrogenase alpha subunit
MGIEGRLMIVLRRAADGTGRATITSSRPLGIAQAFAGQRVDDAVRTLPLLFSVCGHAQGAAAAQACERAKGVVADSETRCARQLLVSIETLREHLVRAGMDWPRFLGKEPQTADMLRAMRLCMRAARKLDPASVLRVGARVNCDGAQISAAITDMVRIIEEIVLGEPIDAWRGRQTAADLDSWALADGTGSQQLVRTIIDRGWAGAGRADVSFLAGLSEVELTERLLGPRHELFVAAPTWDGSPRETSALARQSACPLVADLTGRFGIALLTRIAARLVEIAELPRLMTDSLECRHDAANGEGEVGADAARERSGRGVAQVEAARGRLVHGVEIEDDIVRRYAILAPTEWNFHARGGAARGLAGIAGCEEDARAIADLFVAAVDPCVGYEVRVS